MALPVSLREVVEGLEMGGDESRCFLDKRTGEVIMLTDEDFGEVESDPDDLPEWQREIVQKAREIDEGSEDFLELPDSFEIHEWQIMEDFCNSLEDPVAREGLLERIHGDGAFRRFKDGIYRYKVANEWFRFRGKAFEEIAIRWLEANEIPYTNDIV
jgi:hypothetical protein